MNRKAFGVVATLAVVTLVGCVDSESPGISARKTSASGPQITSPDPAKEPAVGLAEHAPAVLKPEDQQELEQLRRIACSAYLEGDVVRVRLSSKTDADAKVEKIVELTKGFDKLSLRIAAEGFSDAGLERLKALTNLHSLALAGKTQVTDAGLAHLAELSTLRYLKLLAPQYANAGLPHVAGLTDLRHLLVISDNTVSDSDLSHLKALTRLEGLDIWHSAVTDAGLEHLKGLTRLRGLFLDDSRVTYAGLTTLRNATNMREVYTTPALLRKQDQEKMRQIWPNFVGNLLVREGSFVLWDVPTGEEMMIGASRPTFSPDGKRIAMFLHGRLHFVDARTGAPIGRLGHRFPPKWSLPIAFSGDGKRIAVAGLEKTARVWDVATGKQLLELPPRESRLRHVALSPEGQLLAGAEQAGALRLWKVATGERVRDFQASYYPRSLAFSPDGKRLGGLFYHTVFVWNVGDGQKILELEDSPGAFRFSPDGRTLIQTSQGSVLVHDLETGRQLRKYDGGLAKGAGLVLSPDGKFLGTASSIWDVARGRLLHRLHEDYFPQGTRLLSLDFSPDGKRLAVTWGPERGPEE